MGDGEGSGRKGGMRRRKRARGGGREKRGREGVASGRKREKRHGGMVELKEGVEREKGSGGIIVHNPSRSSIRSYSFFISRLRIGYH